MNKINKVINYFRKLNEDAPVMTSSPTMNTKTANRSAGLSASADSSGPNAGNTYPLGKFDGRSKLFKRLSPHFRELFNKTKRRKNK